MADDAGALLVRSGLVSSSSLDAARLQVVANGGTVGEQLVAGGVITDEALTEFYRKRLLVPQVNPNTLAKLPTKVVGKIPADMAVELRAVPVSLDADNNLTVAMSDPSDRHAVDEIAFFTGAYVVRAVATQLQIAWCLAHYYGHITLLGERLLKGEEATAPPAGPTRKKGVTEQVKAMRTKRLERGAMMASDVMAELAAVGDATKMHTAAPEAPGAKLSSASIEPPNPGSFEDGDITAVQPVIGNGDSATPVNTPKARPRTASGEIRVSPRRADSIRPALPVESGPVVIMEADEPSGPVITMEASSRDSEPVITIEADEDFDYRKKPMPRRKKPAQPDPPELAARAGEVQLASGEPMKAIDFDALPSIMISDELERGLRPSAGEFSAHQRKSQQMPLASVSVELAGPDGGPAIIREAVYNEKSEPVLLERKRSSESPVAAPAVGAPVAEIDPDDEVSDVVVLELKKPITKRLAPITQVGIGAVTATTAAKLIGGDGVVGGELDDSPTDARRMAVPDPTRVDGTAAPADDQEASDEMLAAPPPPASYSDNLRDTQEVPFFPPDARSSGTPPPSGAVSFDMVKPASRSDDDDDDDEQHKSKPTIVMSALELDDVIPDRAADPLFPKQAAAGELDDWGPPGSTIPPPLLGAIPGGVVEPVSGIIPIPDMDSAPLMVAPPSPPESASRPRAGGEQGAARVLEESTASVLELIRTLDHATERDQVIALMIAHLAEAHERAGFFAARNNELSLFAIIPRVPTMPVAALRLDRASTLQDVVGTRLPYRGPMHDDASRIFLQATLGGCPPELLLVPISVRERIVGVLFGDHRVRHTFDDQLALAARAAGMALERILKARASR